jgi:hypothetical protein
MTTQAEESRRLFHEIVGYRAVWIMADAAILTDGWMLPDKRPLLVGMAPVASQIDGRLTQVLFVGAVAIVACRALHLAFCQRMV